ncbi:AMP-binding protein [Streptomyces sp. INA 01156]
MAEDPDRPVGRLDVLTVEEWETALSGGNTLMHPVPEHPVQTLLEDLAARTPDATALVFRDTTLTCSELNERANRLARLLIGRGVGPERIVALALPRGAQVPVAMFAVLKAGAAFLTVDPGSRRTASPTCSRTPRRRWCSPTARWTPTSRPTVSVRASNAWCWTRRRPAGNWPPPTRRTWWTPTAPRR